MWAIPTGISSVLKKKKKKNQVVGPSPESRVPETGSDPPIGSGRDSGRDSNSVSSRMNLLFMKRFCPQLVFKFSETLKKSSLMVLDC